MPDHFVLTDQLLEEDRYVTPSRRFDWTCGGRIRWNLLINVIVMGLLAMPFFVPTVYTLALNSYYAFLWFIFMILAWRTQTKVSNYMKNNANATQVAQLPGETPIKFIMATFVYKEPLEMILKTLKNVSQQRLAKEFIMVVCMEERTPNKEDKIKAIYANFPESFGTLLVTVHPYGVEGEIPGKCSNNNYAIRSVHHYLKSQDPNFNPNNYFVTDFDVDTIFHPNFIDIQLQNILQEREEQRNNIVWQPVLFYNWDLDKLSFFTRITGLARNALMMGALIPFNINIMSVYTASLQLYIEGNYCHPFYQMEDIICYIRWFTLSKRNLTIKPIYCPTISGPTSGATMWEELCEWAKQNKRWSIGSAEVFHYFVIKAHRINFFRAFLWAFIYLNYYAGFICVSGMLMITTTISLNTIHADDELRIWFLVPLAVVYTCLFFMIVLNKYAVRNLLKGMMVEKIPIWKDFFHWISSLFVMLAYGLVAFVGFWEIAFGGKSVCGHDASKKADLRTRSIHGPSRTYSVYSMDADHTNNKRGSRTRKVTVYNLEGSVEQKGSVEAIKVNEIEVDVEHATLDSGEHRVNV